MNSKLNIFECLYSQLIIKTDTEYFIIVSGICKGYYFFWIPHIIHLTSQPIIFPKISVSLPIKKLRT